MLQKNKPAPLKIKNFLSKLAGQHHMHDIDNTTQTFKTITKTSPIKNNNKNMEPSIYTKEHFFQSQQYINSPIPKIISQHQIQSQIKSYESQKSFEFKIWMIQCRQDTNEPKGRNLSENSLNSVDILNKLLNNPVPNNQKLRENHNEPMESQLRQFNNKIQKHSKLIKQDSIKNPQSITYLNNQKNIQVQKQSNTLNDSQLKKQYNINLTEKMKNSSIILEKDSQLDLKQNGTTQKKIQKNNKTPQRQFKRIQKQSQISTRQINTLVDFVTQKKKPFQSQNNSPTISQYLVGRTQQHLKQTQSQIKPSKTPDKSASNLLFQLLGNLQTPPEKKQININQSNKLSLNQQNGSNMLLKAFAHIGLKNSESHMQKLKTAMKNQKNLKLKDYLRLASLSNDSKFDNWSKNCTPNKNNLTTNQTPPNQNEIMLSQMKKSFIFNKAKTPIDSQKSITLIKSSLRKKLQKIMNASMKVCMQLQQNKQLIGNEYQDLVFMCNFHKIFDENMFKSADLLQDLLDQYEEKRKFIHMLKRQQMTQETVKQMMSPRRRKKQSNFNLSLIQKILKGLNIIKNEVIQ